MYAHGLGLQYGCNQLFGKTLGMYNSVNIF